MKEGRYDGALALNLDLPGKDRAALCKAAERRDVAPEQLLKRLLLDELPRKDIVALRRELGDRLFVHIVETLVRQLDTATEPKGAPS